MGLDMFAQKTRIKPTTPVDFKAAEDGDEEIAYWRKHPNLHGWMENLYYEKGGKEESFNCVNVQLELDDLLELRNAITNGELPPTDGFFFGASDGTEKDEDLEFVDNAIKAINEGYFIYYSSWW